LGEERDVQEERPGEECRLRAAFPRRRLLRAEAEGNVVFEPRRAEAAAFEALSPADVEVGVVGQVVTQRHFRRERGLGETVMSGVRLRVEQRLKSRTEVRALAAEY